MKARLLKKELRSLATAENKQATQRFFKMGSGAYAASDQFLGVMVPQQRKLARLYQDLPLSEIQLLLDSKFHEERLTALFILVRQFERGSFDKQQKIVDFYLQNLAAVNNWDLVDSSAHKILGPYLLPRDKSLLFKMAKSNNLWQRRIAVLTTYHFIQNGQYQEILDLAVILLADPEDLIHKAVGWMLRELGKQKPRKLESFLRQYAAQMPRTMLRYAIEKFPEPKRRALLRLT